MAVFLMFLFKELLYFLVYLLLNGCNKVVEIVEIFLSEFSLMEVNIASKVLGGFGKDLI
jgi:hypothetical protein